MDLLEKIYEVEIESNPLATNWGFETDLDRDIYYETLQKLISSFKTVEQKALFRNFEICFEDRIKCVEKEMFLNGLSKGIKMGFDADERLKKFVENTRPLPKLPDGYRFDK